MNRPRFTVVLPVHNGVDWLKEAVDSILAQEGASFELLICDDASTDGSPEVLQAIEDERARVFVNEHNRGLFPTLNRLAGEARGEVVRIFTQDDRLKPGALEREDRFWSAAPPSVGMVFCQGDRIDEHGAMVRHAVPNRTPEVMEPWRATQMLFYHGCLSGNISTVSIRRDVLEEVGGFREIRLAGDFDLMARVAAGHSIGFLAAALVDVRVHTGQLSRHPESLVPFLAEQRDIYRDLEARLPAALQKRAPAYQRRHRGLVNMRYLTRMVLRGRIGTARALAAEMRQEWSLLRLFLLSVVTLEGRLWKPKPRYVQP